MTRYILLLVHVMFLVPAHAGEQVIILHGIARSNSSMDGVSYYLKERGYDTHNIDYPSTTESIDMLTDYIYTNTETLWNNPQDTLHFVGYSMGCILIRNLIEKYRPQNLGRVVMLAPPNKGSEVADFWKDNSIYKFFYGPAGQELGTDNNSKPNQLPAANYALGIIAGTYSIDPLSSFIIPGNDDGKVSVERTKIAGMADHITINATHTFIMSNEEALEQGYHFLKHGKFKR